MTQAAATYDLRVYYDGLCPMCLTEIKHLRRLDREQRLDLQDIRAADFTARFPHIDPVVADRVLHGELADGTLIFGLDVSCLAWKLLGKGHWFGFLRWPLIRIFADAGYKVFARYRHHIASWFFAAPVCDDKQCRK